MRRRPLPVAGHVSQTGEVRVLVSQSGRLPRLQQSHLLQPLLDLERPLQRIKQTTFLISTNRDCCDDDVLANCFFFAMAMALPNFNFNYTVTDAVRWNVMEKMGGTRRKKRHQGEAEGDGKKLARKRGVRGSYYGRP